MSISVDEDALFADWKRGRLDFVPDGVVDEKAYLNSTPRIVYVLKEVNDCDGGGWDLRDYVRGGGRSSTWSNIARWTYGIRRLPEATPWRSLEEISETFRRDALQSIAAINLKKSPGGHTADFRSVWQAATEDRKFINKQLGFYEADFIICCGTGDIIDSVIEIPSGVAWERTYRGVWYRRDRDGRVIIDFAHPETRCGDYLLFYGVTDAVDEI